MARKLPSDSDVKTYMQNKSAVIIDSNAVGRSSIMKFLHSMGMPADRIHSHDNFKDGEETIKKLYPDIVFTEYNIHKQHGTELIPFHLEAKQNRLDGSFFVISSSNSMAVAAQIAELEVDGLIIKPFNINSLKDVFLNGIAHKVTPNEYFVELEKARELARAKSTDALEIFKKCKSLSSEPVNACLYEGNLLSELERILEAKESYKEGIGYDAKNFKCLNNLFNLLIKEKKYDEAYDYGLNIFKNFPVSPAKIPELTRLLIGSNHFEQIVELSTAFSKEENIDPILLNYLAAALAIGAKHFARENKSDDATHLITKSVPLSGGNVKILRSLSQTFLLMGKTKEAEGLLRNVCATDQDSDSYKLMDFEISSYVLPASEIIKRGLDLYKRGINDFSFYEILIKKSQESGKIPDYMMDIISKGIKNFPELKELYPIAV